MADKYVNKVKALLRKAASTDSLEEAKTFYDHAQYLITKHAVDEELLKDTDEEVESIVTENIEVLGPYFARRDFLVHSVARHTGVKAISLHTPPEKDGKPIKGRLVALVGHKSDIEVTRALFSSLDSQLASALHKAEPTRPKRENKRTWAAAFITGFVSEIEKRLTAAQEQAEAQVTREQSGSTSTALVLHARDKRVEKEFTSAFPRQHATKASKLASWHGASPGQTAGRNASLNHNAISSKKSLHE